jgi:uncharacterized phage infection (PIP) family protein YhgE
MLQGTLQVKLILENLTLISHWLTLHVLIYIFFIFIFFLFFIFYKVIDKNHLEHVTSVDIK